jgi:hypothetical protein
MIAMREVIGVGDAEAPAYRCGAGIELREFNDVRKVPLVIRLWRPGSGAGTRFQYLTR